MLIKVLITTYKNLLVLIPKILPKLLGFLVYFSHLCSSRACCSNIQSLQPLQRRNAERFCLTKSILFSNTQGGHKPPFFLRLLSLSKHWRFPRHKVGLSSGETPTFPVINSGFTSRFRLATQLHRYAVSFVLIAFCNCLY